MLVSTPPIGGREARLRYVQGSYMLLAPGDYVLCAVSGERILLGELRYWNVEHQEAYASAVHATGAHEARRARR